MSKTMVRFSLDPANPPPLTREQHAELAALAALHDEDIDLSDIPETIFGPNAVRGKFYRPVKQQLTLRVDADVVHWFKANAKDGGYQTRMNAALRQYVEVETRKAG